MGSTVGGRKCRFPLDTMPPIKLGSDGGHRVSSIPLPAPLWGWAIIPYSVMLSRAGAAAQGRGLT